ncbi:MAG: class II glutamine amidotransferase [Deltaproteobacteria bacterium]|nr:class II glutamine amidotransferase [Deltaproteobacteria bacterium]
MCRMLGVVCNDEDLLPCAINEVSQALRCDEDAKHDGIGVGYYSHDEPLLKKRPSAKIAEIDYPELVEGVSSSTLLIHIRKATVGAWKEANTHPFRFRKWLFAHVGHLPGLDQNKEDIVKQLPPFLSRNIKGDTDSEIAFHMFLDILFREGKLNDFDLNIETLDSYLKETVTKINEKHPGPQLPELSIIITNGQIMSAVCQGIAMHYSLREGILECPQCDETDQQKHLHGRFKGVMLGADMSDPGHQWREVADSSLLHVSQELELKVQQL